ncbi:MAG: DUF4131 domain-containing protein [Chloroflexi bacterium]|nr:DUF4131 domain-containing protein [Chloroflexota bacterium]MBT4002003.1 DUF4131 domain-containing protein [Chloroflexota bacterium]MBT4304135.1 DUF4131 domain-containing protein [Chloroflexota bacterium]MBT4683049.1 DUF4131 domain-containing protein [Chloroflexota bacterium]MBT5337095.1 DUF4131 domain-containing protein [Chloroflexota bacterium]
MGSYFSLILLVIILGGVRYQVVLPEITDSHIAWYNNNEDILKITGMVRKPQEKGEYYSNLWVDVEKIQLERYSKLINVEGIILAQIPIGSEIHYGDHVELIGKIQEPLENEQFSYKDYLSRQGVLSIMPYAEVSLLEKEIGKPYKQFIYSIKENALDMIYNFYPDPEASIMAGILLGVETGISKDVKQAFIDTGTSHIIAISGFNITIIAGLFSILFGRLFGKRKGAFIAIISIGIYTILVGADAAVVRAAIMGGLSLFARQVGRRQDGIISLGVTAAVMAIFNPMLLWDVGFQLSFMATLGLVLYAESFKSEFIKFIEKKFDQKLAMQLSGPIGEYFLFTIAAQITILPVLIFHFQRISIISIPANFIILPAQPFVMILGGIGLLFGGISAQLGQSLSYLAWPFITYTIRVVEWFYQFRGGVLIFGQATGIFVLTYYLILFGITKWGKLVREKTNIFKPVWILSTFGLITIFVWQLVLNAPDGNLHVTMLDVGTGDAILIQSPKGRYILVNGGPSSNQLSDQLGRWLPLFHRELDFLVIASTEEGQIKGLVEPIERFLPDQVLWAGAQNSSRSSRLLNQKFTNLQIPVVMAEMEQFVDLGNDARLNIISSGSRGAILLIEWDNFRMLLPLGLSFEELEELDEGKRIGQVNILLLADNGFGPLNPKNWIQNLNPELVLLSVSAGDYEGLPSSETIDLLQDYTLLRTDQNGWIHIITDGQKMWVDVEKQAD